MPTDIIKSNVIGKINPNEQDRYNQIWEDLEVETGRDGFTEVFTHIRMIYAKEKARRALLEEFQDRVISKVDSSEDLINQVIIPYTEAYLIAKTNQYASTENASEINLLLKWLNRIDNSDWLPVAMKFLADNMQDSKYVLWFFSRLERLAAFMHICAYDVNKRINRYSELLKALEQPHSIANPIQAVELTDEEKQIFLKNLDGDIYLMTARRRNYLILRLDSFVANGAATYDSSVLTIEHVLPQTVAAGSDWDTQWPDTAKRASWIHRLANLVPLTQYHNAQAQNYDFQKKKEVYFKSRSGVSSYALTTQVLGIAEWTPSVVENRQQALLEILKNNWNL